MKTTPSVLDPDSNIVPDSRSQNYQMLNHEKYEVKNMQVNLNILKFVQATKNDKLVKVLYQDSEKQQPSTEFKTNLMYFYVFLLIYLLSLAAFAILLNTVNHLSSTHLKIHLIAVNLLIAFSIIILAGLLKLPFLLKYSRILFLLLCSCMNFYLIFADERILHSLTGEISSSNRLPLSIGLIAIIVMARLILFDYFLYTFILGMSTTIIFLTTHLALSNESPYSTLAESTIIALFSILQIIECYRADFRIKQLFWRREQEILEENNQNRNKESYQVPGINTEADTILSKCDLIASNLKHISKVVIYKDIKKLLKSSLVDIEKIKSKVAHGGFENAKIELSPGIDEEDRAFLFEMFMDVKSARGSMNHITVTEISEKAATFPFSRYGVAELESVLSGIGKNWSFDIFFVYSSTGHSISMVSKYLFHKWNITETSSISEESSAKYFQELESAYFHNPYHNACHASDVLHSLLYFLLNTDIIQHLVSIDLLSVIIAALGHDVGHPALTNRFLVNNRDALAIQYNDNSVLENMHCSLTFGLMNKQGCNLLENFQNNDWVTIRKLVIEMIIETDMSKHFEVLAKFRTRAVVLADLNMGVIEDKCSVLAMGLKCADIGHSAKDTNLHVKWSSLVMEEFFAQGDLEKQRSQPISMYCDRDSTDVAKSQIGFIKNICLPLYEVWCKYLNSNTMNTLPLTMLKNNLAYWELSMKKRKATMMVHSNFSKDLSGDIKRRQSEF